MSGILSIKTRYNLAYVAQTNSIQTNKLRYLDRLNYCECEFLNFLHLGKCIHLKP